MKIDIPNARLVRASEAFGRRCDSCIAPRPRAVALLYLHLRPGEVGVEEMGPYLAIGLCEPCTGAVEKIQKARAEYEREALEKLEREIFSEDPHDIAARILSEVG